MRRRKSFPDLERRERAIRERNRPKTPCLNCGDPGGMHFFPPSLGDAGFFVCGYRPNANEVPAS